MIFEHLPVLALNRVQNHDPVEVDLLHLRLTPDETGLTK
jgi:hypothetical protein